MECWHSYLLVIWLVGVVEWTSGQSDEQDIQTPLGTEVKFPGSDNLPPSYFAHTPDCSDTHRPQPNNPNQFQVLQTEMWWTEACLKDLVWNQILCKCDYPGGDAHGFHCRDYRHSTRGETGKYEQFVNGQWIVRDCSLSVHGLVWEQAVCQCVWGPASSGKVTGQGVTPCDIMLNITFDEGVRDEAKGSFIEVGRGVPLQTQPVGSNPNMAGYFQNTALHMWFFSDNELGSSIRLEFQFQIENNPDTRDQYQIMLSNGCNVTSSGFMTPSLAIGYRPADESYLLALQTSNARKAIVCSTNLGAYNWHTVSFIYENGVVMLQVDGQPCIVSQDFGGPITPTKCPLTIGADPLDRSSMYHGFMDNVVFARYCRRFMDVNEGALEQRRDVGDNNNGNNNNNQYENKPFVVSEQSEQNGGDYASRTRSRRHNKARRNFHMRR